MTMPTHQLKGIDEFAGEEPVQLFVVGENRWHGSPTWPPPYIRQTAFCLHSAGNANSVAGDGSLSPVAPSAPTGDDRTDLLPPPDRTGAETDEFVYDPRDPS